ADQLAFTGRCAPGVGGPPSGSHEARKKGQKGCSVMAGRAPRAPRPPPVTPGNVAMSWTGRRGREPRHEERGAGQADQGKAGTGPRPAEQSKRNMRSVPP